MIVWTVEDGAAAQTEGWGIFECYGSDNGPFQLCRIDDPEVFAADLGAQILRTWTDDTEVWEFVRSSGSDLHTKALAFLREQNPAEYESIMQWGAA